MQKQIADELQPFSHLLPAEINNICCTLVQAIKEHRPSIMHCWSDISNLVGGFVSLKMKVPRIVLGLRVMPPPFWFAPTQSELYRIAYDKLIHHSNVALVNNSSVSSYAFESWSRRPAGTIRLVRNGYSPALVRIRDRDEVADRRASLGVPTNALVVGGVMRFAPEKDPSLWLRTAAAIAAVRPDVHFVLAGYGHGDIAVQIRAEATRLNLAERLTMPGAAIDVGQIYRAIDLLLMTSRTDNVPNVMIEAQAAAVPVLGPDVGGISEAMLDGVTGRLASERSADALAFAVLQILQDSGWRKKAVTEDPNFIAQRFGHERMVVEMIATDDNVPGDRSRRWWLLDRELSLLYLRLCELGSICQKRTLGCTFLVSLAFVVPGRRLDGRFGSPRPDC